MPFLARSTDWTVAPGGRVRRRRDAVVHLAVPEDVPDGIEVGDQHVMKRHAEIVKRGLEHERLVVPVSELLPALEHEVLGLGKQWRLDVDIDLGREEFGASHTDAVLY